MSLHKLNAAALYICCDREYRIDRYRVRQSLWNAVNKVAAVVGSEVWQESRYFTGSFYEGLPVSVCSDRDVMVTQKPYPKIYLEEPTDRRDEWHVLAERSEEHPAYLKLRVCGTQDEEFNKHIEKGYLKSESFVEPDTSRGQEQHGPAETHSRHPENDIYGKEDVVRCLICEMFPAQSFLRRQRKNVNWPSREVLDSIKASGCHAVAVGHPRARDTHLEWRWSFSLAEKELIYNMTPEMVACMYILKSLKKKDWQPQEENEKAFTSYIIKTSCFWVIEDQVAEDEALTNPLLLAEHVLSWMDRHFAEKILPHYFIPEQNLLDQASNGAIEKAHDFIRSCRESLESRVEKIIMNPNDETSMGPLYGRDSITLEELWSNLPEYTTSKDLYWLSYYSSAEYSPQMNTLNTFLKSKSDKVAVDLLGKFIEETMAIYTEISKRINPKWIKMFGKTLLRFSGTLFHCILKYGNDLEAAGEWPSHVEKGTILQDLYQGAEDSFKRSMKMVYPIDENGWNDKQISGRVHLALFYYLNDEKKKAMDTFAQTETTKSLEDAAQDTKLAACSPCITVDLRDKESEIRIAPWQADESLYGILLKRRTEKWAAIHFNPINLAFYLKARLALECCDFEQVRRNIERNNALQRLLFEDAIPEQPGVDSYILNLHRKDESTFAAERVFLTINLSEQSDELILSLR